MRLRSSLTKLFFFYWSASFAYQDMDCNSHSSQGSSTRSLAGDEKISQLDTDDRIPHKCLPANSRNNFFHDGLFFMPDENFTVSAPAGPKTSIQILLLFEQHRECFYAPPHLLFSISSGSRVGHNKHSFPRGREDPYWEEEECIT